MMPTGPARQGQSNCYPLVLQQRHPVGWPPKVVLGWPKWPESEDSPAEVDWQTLDLRQGHEEKKKLLGKFKVAKWEMVQLF